MEDQLVETVDFLAGGAPSCGSYTSNSGGYGGAQLDLNLKEALECYLEYYQGHLLDLEELKVADGSGNVFKVLTSENDNSVMEVEAATLAGQKIFSTNSNNALYIEKSNGGSSINILDSSSDSTYVMSVDGAKHTLLELMAAGSQGAASEAVLRIEGDGSALHAVGGADGSNATIQAFSSSSGVPAIYAESSSDISGQFNKTLLVEDILQEGIYLYGEVDGTSTISGVQIPGKSVNMLEVQDDGSLGSAPSVGFYGNKDGPTLKLVNDGPGVGLNTKTIFMPETPVGKGGLEIRNVFFAGTEDGEAALYMYGDLDMNGNRIMNMGGSQDMLEDINAIYTSSKSLTGKFKVINFYTLMAFFHFPMLEGGEGEVAFTLDLLALSSLYSGFYEIVPAPIVAIPYYTVTLGNGDIDDHNHNEVTILNTTSNGSFKLKTRANTRYDINVQVMGHLEVTTP